MVDELDCLNVSKVCESILNQPLSVRVFELYPRQEAMFKQTLAQESGCHSFELDGLDSHLTKI